MVVPGNSDAPRLVVVHDFDRTIGYLFDYDAFTRHNYFGEEPPDDDLEDLAARRALLASLSTEFGLSPWPDARARFDVLQKKWSHQVELVL